MIDRKLKKKKRNSRNDGEGKNLKATAHYGTAENYCTPILFTDCCLDLPFNKDKAKL